MAVKRRQALVLTATATAFALAGCGGSNESTPVTVTVTTAAPARTQIVTSTETAPAATEAGERPTTRVERFMQSYEDGQLSQWVEDVSWYGGEVKNVGGEPEVRGVFMWVHTLLANNARNRNIAQHVCNVSIEAILAEEFGDSVAGITVWDKDGYELLDCPTKVQAVTLPEPPPPPPPTPPSSFPDPTLPNTVAGAKQACGRAKVTFDWGTYSWDYWVISGEVTCAEAKEVLNMGMQATGGWQYIDWTKGGNGPWSDVWSRNADRDVVAAIVVE